MAYVPFEIDQDLTNVKEFAGGGGGPSLPPGEYVFDVVDMQQGVSNTNNPTIKVTFETVEGEYQGTQLVATYSQQPQALGRYKRLAIACGARLDKIRSEEIFGARIRATVVHNEGAIKMNPDGTQMPPRVFANVENERPYEVAAPVVTTPPPVTRKAANNGAVVRRA